MFRLGESAVTRGDRRARSTVADRERGLLMTPELENLLYNRYPIFFARHNWSTQESSMALGLCHQRRLVFAH